MLGKIKPSAAIEVLALIAFFTLILYLGHGTSAGHAIRHDFPAGLGASDAYLHAVRAEGIREMGSYRYEAPYTMAGYTDVLGAYPPVLYHLSVLVSLATGMETYDSIILVIAMSMAIAVLIMYFAIKTVDMKMALLSLPAMLLIASGKQYLGGVVFGQLIFMMGSFFLVASVWAMSREPNSVALMGLFFAATLLSHTSETVFLVLLVGLAMAYSLAHSALKGKISGVKSFISEHRKYFMAGLLAAVISIYFLQIFWLIWMKAQPYQGIQVEKVSGSFPAATVNLPEYNFMLIFLGIGILLTAYLYFRKSGQLHKLLNQPKLLLLGFSLFMLLVGFGNYAGLGLRAFQTRFYWPITLAPLFAFGFYQAIKFVHKKLDVIQSAGIALIITGIVLFYLYIPAPPGAMDKARWDGMAWIAENTPSDAVIYVLYSDVYQQSSSLYNTKRVTRLIDINDLAASVNQQQLRRDFNTALPFDGAVGLPYRQGLGFGFHKGEKELGGRYDLCSADYFLVDKASTQVSQINQQIEALLLQHSVSVAYSSSGVSVLRNENPGGDCLG